MNNNRQLNWNGCSNVRDLGGLSTRDGRMTRFGAVVRSDTPSRLTAEGWSALYDHGIRTIITLRTHGMTENELDFTLGYPDIAVVQAAIEDITDKEFLEKWAASELWSTPLYYKDALQRWPERHAAVISSIAQAQSGGVLFHCKRGVDRTGIITLLLLGLVGVTQDEILEDYVQSLDPGREEILKAHNTSTREVILETIAGLDVENYLLEGGVTRAELDSVKVRLLESR